MALLQIYWNPILKITVGPMIVGSAEWRSYADIGSGWVLREEYEGELTQNQFPDNGPFGFPRQPPPGPAPIPNPPVVGGNIPAGGVAVGDCGVWIIPGEVTPGYLDTVVESFKGKLEHEKYNQYSALVGSKQWQMYSSRHDLYSPLNRYAGIFIMASHEYNTEPWHFPIVGGKPQCVPETTYPDAIYACYNIGYPLFGGTSRENTQHKTIGCPAGTTTTTPQPPPTETPPTETPPYDCGFYDCPGRHGGECCHDTRPMLTAIATAIDNLALKLVGETKDCYDISEACLDKIIDKVLKRLTAARKTCKECQEALTNKVALSSEEAFMCALQSCTTAENQCKLGSLSLSGGSCTGCGKEPCCCKDGDCKPCDDKPVKRKWFAYCSPVSGLIYVSQSEGSPSSDYIFVGSYDTESEATQKASYTCRPKDKPKDEDFPKVNPKEPTATSSSVCNINAYSTQSGIRSIVGQFADEQVQTFAADVVLQSIQSLDTSTSWVPGVGAIVGALRATAMSKPRLALAFAPQIIGLMGCQDGEARLAAGAIGAAATVSEYTGVNVLEYAPHLSYALHATCRNKQLSPGEAAACWLSGSVNDSVLDTHWAIAGYCEDSVERYKQAARTKLGALELATLRHRESIGESEYHARMRQLGYIDNYEREQAYELTNQVPVTSDIIRMMVRDADDASVAETFGTDSQFGEKYGKQLKKWAKDQGIPDIYMQYLWRSHWSIPSPGQLFTMYQRLRHDPNFNGDGKLLDNVKMALVQQDILPFWQDKLLAIAFRPLSRVDVRRAYEIGAIDDDGVRKSYWDQGYDDANTEALLQFAKKLRGRNAANHPQIKLWIQFAKNRGEANAQMVADGYPQEVATQAFVDASVKLSSSWPVKAFTAGDMDYATVRTTLQNHGADANAIEAILSAAAFGVRRHIAVLDYDAGYVDRADARARMIDYGIAEGKVNRLLESVDSKITATNKANCRNAIKQRYLLGELDADEARDTLEAFGITKERAVLLTGAWACERSVIGRAIPGATLCDWLSQGVITPKDFVNRLTNIGFRSDDAGRMLADCKGKINAKAAADAMKEAKAEAAAIERQRKQMAKAEAMLLQQQAQIKRANEAGQAARKRRSAQLIKAVEKLYKKVDYSLEAVQLAVNAVYERIRPQYALSPDEALQSLLQAAEAFSGDTLDSYAEIADGFARAIVKRAMERDESSTAPL